ncbi:PRC-barrel domain-containing protein [Pontibacillus marinus]|uniref:PRC-barrel domain-containing protein n=1 Tax=Pontibacillus marinus BH030004 = DSM 16465 TaxID=1385511 RepID=A0A0A5HIE9_9BACI|nr:PRC-barrel domain-containing protein [Pontibacillus marinus]KGX83412.1 hypothetical protein N783_03770 [Pontibacillus marinus BH030004 = DSM 16465]
MLFPTSKLEGLRIDASDGELGKIKDIYFDDKKWTIRYVVADTRKWLPGKKVLLSPASLKEIPFDSDKIEVDLDKETIRNAPPIEDHEPVSVRNEMELSRYYGWSPYWEGEYLWGTMGYPQIMEPGANPTMMADEKMEQEKKAEDNPAHPDHNLRSVREVAGEKSGYRVFAQNQEIGHLEDFSIQQETYKLQYMVINTGSWLNEKLRILSTDWIESIDWENHIVKVDIDPGQLKNAPDYDYEHEVTRDVEEHMHQLYAKPFQI